MKRPALLSSFGSTLAKREPRLPVEPLTPSPSSRAIYQQSACSRLVSGVISTQQLDAGLPQYTLSESGCSDDEDSMDTPVALPSSPLPMPTKAVATRRRAYRSKALKRSRARHVAKDELSLASSGSGSVGSSANNTTTSTDIDAGEDDPDHPFDKKIARAIRNRQAAQRSRVEAKAKMQELAVANDQLAFKVEALRAENETLNKQLQAVIEHSFGQGHDITEVLSIFERAKSCSIVDQFCC
jgi:Basic region leucine zipper